MYEYILLYIVHILTLSGPGGGGNIAPLWQALQQKLEKPATWSNLSDYS